MFNPQDHYFHQAKKDGYIARSVYKLQEIQEKFHILDDKQAILDIGCAPWSWLQYTAQYYDKKNTAPKIIGVDLKSCSVTLPRVKTYQCDATDRLAMQGICTSHNISLFDCLLSDMAPDTIGNTKADALRSTALIEETLWLYQEMLGSWGTCVVKVFMGPGYEELYRQFQQIFWGKKALKIYKPKACRSESKEIYFVGHKK